MKWLLLLPLLLLGALTINPVRAANGLAQEPTIDELRRTQAAQDREIRDLRTRVNQLQNQTGSDATALDRTGRPIPPSQSEVRPLDLVPEVNDSNRTLGEQRWSSTPAVRPARPAPLVIGEPVYENQQYSSPPAISPVYPEQVITRDRSTEGRRWSSSPVTARPATLVYPVRLTLTIDGPGLERPYTRTISSSGEVNLSFVESPAPGVTLDLILTGYLDRPADSGIYVFTHDLRLTAQRRNALTTDNRLANAVIDKIYADGKLPLPPGESRSLMEDERYRVTLRLAE